MKKILIFTFIFSNLLLSAQKLIVTPEGLKDSLNLDKSYVVINLEGKTAKELYDSAIKYINVTYKNPKEVLKGNIENEFISFETYVSDFPIVKNGGVLIKTNTKYTTQLSFKDGKIKYEIISIEMKTFNSYFVSFKGSVWGGFPIYNNDNEMKRENTKADIEKYFNNNIKNISDFILGKSNKSDGW